ncbi:hypothetical protein HPB50_021668 [Hyalomma asiaticum]|uniref:Uncharacterized protein n=1 Tax=Hyalomma asiaticum TaxID=266040 RepID=A0ACB7TB10_HYAAI|nr:hypothetical protein HPB50_021668 [Hyalomma asiaticum]
MVAAVQSWAVPTQKDGRLLLEDLEFRMRPRDFHCPKTRLLCLENTHNVCGGTVLPVDYLEQAARFAKTHGIPLHMDGARIMNAATYLGLPVKDLVRGCDTVMMCISKTLTPPAGIMFSFCMVSRVRKCLGGGMRQAGIVAAAGLVSLKTIVPRLHEDHENTQRLARGVPLKGNPLITMDLGTVQTNMAVYDFHDIRRLSPVTFCDRLQKVTQREYEDLQRAISGEDDPHQSKQGTGRTSQRCQLRRRGSSSGQDTLRH